MKKRKIVILSKFAHELTYEKEQFSKREDVELVISPKKEVSEVLKVVSDAEVILFTDVPMDADFLSKLTKCKLIIRYGIGYDNIDTKAAKELGITVCNAPNYGVTDVAEHAISLMLSVSKRLTYMNDCIRDKMWSTGDMGTSVRLSGKTIGFLGFGKIAKCVCERMTAFKMKPLVYDPYVSGEVLKEYGASGVDFDTLLTESDVITLHLPLSEKTKHIISKEEFKKMKPSAFLINTSRGGLVNEADLKEALMSGEIRGAGLDVFKDESGKLDEAFLTMKNVALTPHVAWNTDEAMESLHIEVTENVLRYLNGEIPESIVNKN